MEKTEPESSSQNQIKPSVTMNQLLQLLQQLNTNKSAIETTNSSVHLTEKLNNSNYAKWSRLMHLAISGRGRLNHIIASPPSTNDPGYATWVQRDASVFSWIIENIDAELVNQYLDYPTAYELWRGIEIMYSSSQDILQIFDLTVKANTSKQGKDTIEAFYSKLVVIWKEIDRRMPNPMKCPEDIAKFNEITQRDRLYQFLAGIDNSMDKKRRDLLNQSPLPTVEVAYSTIRREIARRTIMNGGAPSLEETSSGIGSGFVSQNRHKNRREDERSYLRCEHCGGTRHIKEGCFKLIGYPKWWQDKKKKGYKIGTGATMTGVFNETRREEQGGTKSGGIATVSSSQVEKIGCSDGADNWAWY